MMKIAAAMLVGAAVAVAAPPVWRRIAAHSNTQVHRINQ